MLPRYRRTIRGFVRGSFISQASAALAAYWLLAFAIHAAVGDDRPAVPAKAVVGRVVDQRGQGVGGVKVSARVDGKRGPESLTDAGGAFQLALPAKDIQGLALSAEHPDFVRGYVFFSAADLQAALKSPETMTIPLDPGTVVGGFIRGEKGEPIANAHVKLSLTDGAQRHELEVKTDADGRWRAHVPTGMRADRFYLYHTEYVCEPISYYVPPDEPLHAQQAVSVMKRGYPVHGKVHDAQGKPVANALVLTQPYNIDMANPDDDLTITRTRDDGTFAIHNMPAGPGAVAVYADSYAPTRVAVDVGDATPTVDAELSPAGELTGQIVDDRGEGVPNVWIYLGQWQPEPSFPLGLETNTDREGRFHLGPLPRDGWFDLNYQKNGFLSMTRNDMRAQSEPCTLTIMRPTTIHGQVLDDETDEPIKIFTVVKGSRWSRTDDMVFNHTNERHNVAVHSDDGRFAVALDNSMAIPPYPEVAVRVVAPGYLPAETEPVAAGKQPAAITFRLKRGEPITGLVVDSAGEPAAYAQVAWVGPKRTAFIQNGHFMDDFTYRPEIIVKTDNEGTFELPANRHDGLIVVVHEKGYAQRRRGEDDAASPLRLTPWGRVEGRALAGSAPIANASVKLRRPEAHPPEQQAEISWSFYQRTHVDGRFAFDYVPPIPFTAACYRAMLDSHKTRVMPKPGETVRIEIGGHGGAVTGRFEKPDGLRLETFTDGFEAGVNCTQVVAYPAEQVGEKKENRDNFVALLNSDGTFTIHDLSPGAYRLDANVHAAAPPNSCGLPVSLAIARTQFRIGGGSDGEGGDVALQLPTLKLKLVLGPQVGQMAPELTGKTLSGEAFDLADLRGKPVLLDFWGTWCGPCKAATPAIKHLYETYGRDGRMRFVGVDLDYSVETAGNYVEQEGLAWPQVATGSWGEDNAILQAFAVTSAPSFWLIGADGTILARDIPLVDLDRQVEAALKKARRP